MSKPKSHSAEPDPIDSHVAPEAGSAEQVAPAPVKDPLILTIDEHAALSPEAQSIFRSSGGTVTSNPSN